MFSYIFMFSFLFSSKYPLIFFVILLHVFYLSFLCTYTFQSGSCFLSQGLAIKLRLFFLEEWYLIPKCVEIFLYLSTIVIF